MKKKIIFRSVLFSASNRFRQGINNQEKIIRIKLEIPRVGGPKTKCTGFENNNKNQEISQTITVK